MKKIIVFLLVVTLLAFSLVSCGGDKTNDNGDTSNGNTAGNAEDGVIDDSAKNRSSVMDDFRNGMNDIEHRMTK